MFFEWSVFSLPHCKILNIPSHNILRVGEKLVYKCPLQIKELWKAALMFLSAEIYPTVYKVEILRLTINGGFSLTLDPLYRLPIASDCCTAAATDKTLPIHVIPLILVQEIKLIISKWSGEFILIWAQKETMIFLFLDRQTSVEIG